MPWRTEFVEPEVALEHKGVKVYHTYRHDDVNDLEKDYWFTLDPVSDEHQFDVRDLKNWKPVYDLGEKGRICALRNAIDQGLLTNRED